MPTTVTVKVNTPGNTTRGGKNMIELTGLDHTNNRGFKKAFFETKRDGGLTAAAKVAQTLQKDDWVEVTMDDSQWANVTSLKKVSAPAGGENVPDSTQGQKRNGGGKRDDKMSKEEWALKDAKKALSMARHKAIESCALMVGEKGITKATVDALKKLAPQLTAYILTGDFNGEVAEPKLEDFVTVAQTDNTSDDDNIDDSMAANPEDGADQGVGGPAPEDDDIPF